MSHHSFLGSDDEPEILSYEKASKCSIGADVGQVGNFKCQTLMREQLTEKRILILGMFALN